MKVRLYDVVKELEEDGFKLSVKTEDRDVHLVVTKSRIDGGEDLVARLNLHNNIVGPHEEWNFWERVGLYSRA
ncbi:hypothetical protein [Bradyrhizobium liaoningense]|uniref:hypothetical protein n=1 Tax=Bradyrhizobium liaoningense TaxID=43992 RepID=UPI001BAE1B8B|nr:hypothetical protein [Bradyrhizobium liaoningense]MBR0823497.1 hypothetical protein [Bradyrhizobium liaoningense]